MILVFRNTAKSDVDSMAVLESQESEEIESQQNDVLSVEPESMEEKNSSSYYDN